MGQVRGKLRDSKSRDWLTTAEVARAARCCSRTIINVCERGEIKFWKLSHGDRRFLKTEIRKYFEVNEMPTDILDGM